MRVAKEIKPEIERRLNALASVASRVSPQALTWSWKDQFYSHAGALALPRPWAEVTVTTALELNAKYSIVGAAGAGRMVPVPGQVLKIANLGDFVLQDATGTQWLVDVDMVAECTPKPNAWALLLAQMLVALALEIEDQNHSIATTVCDITLSLEEAAYWLACDAINGPFAVRSLWDDPSVFLECGDPAAEAMAEEFKSWLRVPRRTSDLFDGITDMGRRRLVELETLFGEWRERHVRRPQRNRRVTVKTDKVMVA